MQFTGSISDTQYQPIQFKGSISQEDWSDNENGSQLYTLPGISHSNRIIESYSSDEEAVTSRSLRPVRISPISRPNFELDFEFCHEDYLKIAPPNPPPCTLPRKIDFLKRKGLMKLYISPVKEENDSNEDYRRIVPQTELRSFSSLFRSTRPS